MKSKTIYLISFWKDLTSISVYDLLPDNDSFASSIPVIITPMNKLRITIVPTITNETKNKADPKGEELGEVHSSRILS